MQRFSGMSAVTRLFGALALLALAIALLLYVPVPVNTGTVGLVLLLTVTVVTVLAGRGAGILASLLGTVAFNYFFLPPVHAFSVAKREDWIVLVVFPIAALVVGQLSAVAEQRAKRAEAQRLEIEKLYGDLKRAFEQASEAESLRRSEQMKSALLDAVTHDLRTPLTAIKAAATTLLNDDERVQLDPAARRELHEVIDEEADRLNEFVQNMMDLAQIEAGRLALVRERCTVQQIVEAALERGAAVMATHEIELAGEELADELNADPRLVAQVLYVLLENAAKYSPARSRIGIAISRKGEELRFSVSDEGSGVAVESRGRIFEKFYRDPRESKKTAGHGIGLAVAKGIVEAHGGRIWVEDGQRGRGSVFSFALPAAVQHAPEVAHG